MHRITFLPLAALLTLASCQGSTDTSVPQVAAPAVLHSSRDTLVVDRRAAVFYGPSDTALERQRKELGEEDFATVADDYAYYTSEAGMFFDSVGLQRMDAEQHRYIAFAQNGKLQQLVRTDTIPEKWGVFFYTAGKAPRRIDLTMAQEEYAAYFQ